MRHCIDNHEADIGSFIPVLFLWQTLTLDTLRAYYQRRPSRLQQRSERFESLAIGHERFVKALSQRRPWEAEIVPCFEASIIIDGDFPQPIADEDFYNDLQLRKPRLSGWEPWIDFRSNDEHAPYVFEDAWECLL